jgi:uncharacterized membrane protein YfcA
MRNGSAMAAAFGGAAVGVLGGLIGLGGAEFRLPLLVGFFSIPLRRAIGLNLGVSLLTVLAALGGRLVAGSASSLAPSHIIVALMGGGVAGAYLGASWLIGASSHALWRGVRGLLAMIGVLLLVEAFVPWRSAGLVTTPIAQSAAGVLAGVLIGVVSSLLGVAGGELIIPTLVFGFGVDIKTAGTASLMISVPTVLMGLWRQGSSGLRPTAGELTGLVLPMSAGSVVGAIVGALLVGFVPGSSLKMVLGLVLIVSAARLRGHAPVDRKVS